MQDQVLIVDDDPLVCKSLSEVISRAGYGTRAASDGYEALEAIEQEEFSVVVTDMSMPKMDGLEVLRKAKTIIPHIAVVIMTGYATIDSAVKAMKHGAHDYITKPFPPSKIETVIRNAISHIPGKALTDMVQCDVVDSDLISPNHKIVTADPQMLDILDKVRLVAEIDSTILIQGESGTGKELIARSIHGCSPRADGPYVAFNCAALPEGLIESELFGHEKGAFTGAVARRIGKLELANGGTILLDEVSEMARSSQAKLLRAIQEREVVRVGGASPVVLDVRIIATTNKKLSDEVDKGNFREDLFYRLCVVPIILPPLRERKDDIPILARYFVQRFCARMRRRPKALPQKTVEALKEYPWPGNVRELENTIERAIALSQDDVVSTDHLFFSSRNTLSRYFSLEIGTSLRDAEQEIILRTLKDVDGNKRKAADILGITTKTIRAKLRQYGYEDLSLPENMGEYVGKRVSG
jgi:DNA-binding NtrC family response regulator